MKSCNAKRRRQRRTTVKNSIGLINKKATLHEHTFFVHFFAVVLHDYNVKLPETSLEKMSHAFLFTFFFTAAHFHLALVATSISHVVTAAITKFSCRSSNRKVSFGFFISRSRSLSPFLSLSFAGVPPTFSISLSFSCSAIFQICGQAN